MIVRSTIPFQAYNELNIVILDHLAKLLGFSESKTHLSIISDFFASENSLEPMLRWQRESFFEWYAGTTDLDLNVLLGKMVRDNPVIPFDSSLLGASPKNIQIPPLTVALVPVSWRDSELTVASWVPGLETLVDQREFQLLNQFWGVRRIGIVWSEPRLLRETIKQFVNASEDIVFQRVDGS